MLKTRERYGGEEGWVGAEGRVESDGKWLVFARNSDYLVVIISSLIIRDHSFHPFL